MLLYKCARSVDSNLGIILVCFSEKATCNFSLSRFKKLCLDYSTENYFVCFYFAACSIMF